MTETEHGPLWFKIYNESVGRELKEIKSTLREQDSKLDQIHEETQKTNGTVKLHTKEIVEIKRQKEDDENTRTGARRHRHLIFATAGSGGIGAAMAFVIQHFLHA